MEQEYNRGDAFICRMDTHDYDLFVVTECDWSHGEYFGTQLGIYDSGVRTHFNVSLEHYFKDCTRISGNIFYLIVKEVEKSLEEAIHLLKHAPHIPALHLEVGSYYGYLSYLGRWEANRVLYFKEISDDTPGVHIVQRLEEEGGEMLLETFDIGNLTFHFGNCFLRRDVVDPDEDFLFTKKTYKRIAFLHAEMLKNITEILQMNFLELKVEGGKYGYEDRQRGVTIPCQWSDASSFSEGLAAVANEWGRWGYIDNFGFLVISYDWKGATPFSEGLAAVMDLQEEWGFIDRTGKLVIPCEWTAAEPFQNGRARVTDSDNHSYLIDREGHIVEIL